ncbi:helix-turn-helix transcriptional regulator [Cryptosporangium aurantiacum]|uniref:Transcriptional regulator, AraC family n=1 Tax=Cryptosporangium aurantiacum TaxID=134849 RepID=A0A1M7RG94_9ACTN|nr:AraC family transcriptional regulator [Cryptosporangium aurantiacum]SHN45315.1 transcriptional regulator, AraC family [Cryptosporangium aurantiacum]
MQAGPLSRTCYRPRLWLWPGQAVYVGPSLGLDPHRGSVACLAIAIGGTFTVGVDGVPGPPVRSALIPPRLTHQVIAAADRMAFCYLDPASSRYRDCVRVMTTSDTMIAYRHRHEDVLAATAGDLTDETAQGWLDTATGPHGAMDPRIRTAVSALYEHADRSAADLAALVGLSPSRFLHLFGEATGTSFRRYRLWVRMRRAAGLIRDGADLTTAAVDAGFASPSHFTSAFHAMFGLPPRHLLGTDITICG